MFFDVVRQCTVKVDDVWQCYMVIYGDDDDDGDGDDDDDDDDDDVLWRLIKYNVMLYDDMMYDDEWWQFMYDMYDWWCMMICNDVMVPIPS